jgi:hypothetical protein
MGETRTLTVRGLRKQVHHSNPNDRNELLWINNDGEVFHYQTHHGRCRWRQISEDEIPECFNPINSKEEEAKRMSSVSKKLSMCLLISSSEFGRLTPAKQTEVLATAAGLPMVFVDSFGGLRNKKTLIERLLKGEDVAMELEFNEISLTDDEKKILEAVRPLLERVRGAAGKYDWQIDSSEVETFLREKNWRLVGANQSIRNPGGYELGKPSCKKVWNEASKVWGAEGKADHIEVRTVNGYDRVRVTVTKDKVQLGCQTISRKEAEAIALYYGFEPNIGDK